MIKLTITRSSLETIAEIGTEQFRSQSNPENLGDGELHIFYILRALETHLKRNQIDVPYTLEVESSYHE